MATVLIAKKRVWVVLREKNLRLNYERGLEALGARLGEAGAPLFYRQLFCRLKQALEENLDKMRHQAGASQLDADRSVLVAALDQLALLAEQQSFSQLCLDAHSEQKEPV